MMMMMMMLRSSTVFLGRVVNTWNILPNLVVGACTQCTVNASKARLSFGSTKQLNLILQPI